MAETININTYPIQETITVNTVEDVTTINVNVIQSTGAVTSVNGQTGNVVLDIPEVNENTANILASNGLNDGHNFHTFYQVGGALFAGERPDGSRGPRFLKYPDKDDLTNFEYIQMTNAGVGVNGFESICYDSATGNFYGLLSNTNKIITIPAANISAYTITTVTSLPSGATFAGSGGIVTDGTYLWVGTEQSPHSWILKINKSTLAVVASYEWSRPNIHSANISLTTGYAVFSTNGGDCYALRVKLSDFSVTEYQLGGDGYTDDFALLDDFVTGYEMIGIFGAEYLTNGNKCKVLIFDTGDIYDINFMPSTGVYYDPNTFTIFNCSLAGFIETITADDLVAAVFDGTKAQQIAINSYTMRGYWVNELALYWNGTSNDIWVTTWNNTTSGSIKKVELLRYDNPLITNQQQYYLELLNPPTISSLNADVIVDGTTNKAYTSTEKSKLASITAIFTTALKSTYDSTVSSLTSLLATGSRLITSAEITKLSNTSGTNTGDQDLSSYATASALTSGLATKQNSLGYTAEDAANKSTSVTTDQASNAKFPSVKSVYDWATGLFATKTMGAYSFRVNNTNATANSTETNFKQLPQATLSTTPTFTAGTAPSGTTNHSTSGQYMGNVFFGKIDLNYSVAGATVTVVVVPLPSDWPTPIKPAGFTAASERIAIGVGFSATNTTGVTQSQYACILRSNASNNGFELVLSQASASSRYFHLTIAYPTA